MKALVIHGKEDLRLEELPTPTPGPGQVLMRVAYAGICGSDLHYYFDGANGDFVVREAMVPGHEITGLVAADPSGTWAPNTPITVHPATFGTCPPDQPQLPDQPHLWPGGAYLGSAATMPHTQGGMSEYLLVRADQVRPLPAGLPLRRSVLAEPLSIGLHAINQAGGVDGKRVLVIGAGPIGLLAAGACQVQGAAEVWVADVLDQPLRRAQELGVADIINLAKDPAPSESFDCVLECSGVHRAISTALGAARRRGQVIQVGMVPAGDGPVTLSAFIAKEVTWIGVFRFRDEVDQAVQMLADHPQLESVLTHVMPATQAASAFALARDSAASGKVAIDLWFDFDN